MCYPTDPQLYKEGSNTALVFLFPADTNHSYRLEGVHFSYSGDPTGGYVLVEIKRPDDSGYVTVDKHFVTKGGAGPLEFVGGHETQRNTALRVTLSAGGSGIDSALALRGFVKSSK